MSVEIHKRTSHPIPYKEKTKEPSILQSLGSRTQSVEVTKPDTDGKSKVKEYCRTLFAYEGTNEDELTFKEGEIIYLISKDTGEAGWWKGELNGKEGVFPDNFAVLISELDKDFPKPKKPPPPVKGPAPKPDLLAAEKKAFPLKSEEKDEKSLLEQKRSKPAAPQVPPKKPTPPTKANNLLKSPGTVYPKRPDKPVPPPPPAAKINGDVSTTVSSKIEAEPVSKPKLDPEQLPVRPKSVDFDAFIVRNSKETELKAKAETDDGEKSSLDEFRAQILELLCIVEALKKDHGRELEKLRRELEEEKAMRSNLEVEIARLKKVLLSS